MKHPGEKGKYYFKTLMVYGIPQSAILISNSMNESKSNTLSIPTGIEIMIYAD